MKKITFLIALLFPVLLNAQSGKVMDNLKMDSKILKMERNYAVYLPPGYETSERSYPVLYLLHGATDNHTGWIQFGEVLHITDKAIQEGTATPMIIIMPDADTKVMGYFNVPDYNYEDFFFEEFIPHVEQKYRIKSTKRFRAVAGLSMGGGGSFMYGLRHPDMFSSACPLSAYVGPLTLEQADLSMKRRNPGITDAQVKSYFENYNALNLLAKADVEKVKSVRWYIDCGDDDFLYEGNSQMHIEMRKKEIPHEYRVRDGGHRWSYWRSALPEVLRFVSDSFHQN
ncbi:alpha/beta hydrolase [Arcticibacterium luteifluviistationis]|uniref:1,4-beta-xylanase n=1 Tax=Arcticibacterium luteifluviistationis TaxID=1784714 RepID=A0A2Z4GEL8_9BACT|nr:alpha/beta hydrolase-fold protein [Arcticibacterium luteifluviistationis]AWV99581.1 1,4-beta-xylanase [Arcticibacterium luteifluviistationis]